VRFGSLFERQDVGMKVDEALADGFERAFGCGADRLGVGWEIGAPAEAEDCEIGDPESVGLYAVPPIAAGVADGQQSPERAMTSKLVVRRSPPTGSITTSNRSSIECLLRCRTRLCALARRLSRSPAPCAPASAPLRHERPG
jgi:hypothetical protein